MVSVQGVEPDSAMGRIVQAMLTAWPEHAKFLGKSFSGRSPSVLANGEVVAGMIGRLTDGRSESLCAGYRWMCEMVREEDLYFRRHGRYRLSTFEEAYKAIYSDTKVMDLYMKGLLLSQVLWSNHALVLDFFIEEFLRRGPQGITLLEVGPGHGLLMALAARYANCTTLRGWDVSATSLDHTSKCLRLLGVSTPVRLETHNVLDGAPIVEKFDSVIVSEVCEHLEQPLDALRALRVALATGGRIFVNVPINAPATDHIYLLESPEAVVDMVRQAGFLIDKTCFAPASGYTESEARKRALPISVAVIGRA